MTALRRKAQDSLVKSAHSGNSIGRGYGKGRAKDPAFELTFRNGRVRAAACRKALPRCTCPEETTMTRYACLSMTLGLLLFAPWAAPAFAARAPQDKAGADKSKEEKSTKQEPAKKAEKLTPQDLAANWETLAGNDAAKAYRAIWALVADPERSVPFLSKHLQPVPPPDQAQLKKLIKDLDSPRFQDRERAMTQLERMGALAKDRLLKALNEKPSLETRRRLEKLLDKLSTFTLSGEELRTWRALEVLELIGNAAARQVLQRMAKGAPSVWQTEEARAALDRLSKRVAIAP